MPISRAASLTNVIGFACSHNVCPGFGIGGDHHFFARLAVHGVEHAALDRRRRIPFAERRFHTTGGPLAGQVSLMPLASVWKFRWGPPHCVHGTAGAAGLTAGAAGLTADRAAGFGAGLGGCASAGAASAKVRNVRRSMVRSFRQRQRSAPRDGRRRIYKARAGGACPQSRTRVDTLPIFKLSVCPGPGRLRPGRGRSQMPFEPGGAPMQTTYDAIVIGTGQAGPSLAGASPRPA